SDRSHVKKLLEEAHQLALGLVLWRKYCRAPRECACNKRPPVDLARRRSRKLAVKGPGARHQRLGETCGQESAQFVFAGLSGADMGHQVAIDGDDCSTRYTGGGHKHRVDLGG